MKANFGGSKEA